MSSSKQSQNNSSGTSTASIHDDDSGHISPIVSTRSNFVLDHYIRPNEIESCIYSAPKGVTRLPVTCACRLSGLPVDLMDICADGYIKAGQHMKTNPDPNAGLLWCVNNVPKTYKDNKEVEKYDGWLTGCVNGVTGKHTTV